MPLRAKPTDPYPSIPKVDARLTELATLLRSENLAAGYRTALECELDQLLDRRNVLALRELVQTG